jgi:hypothetical protein
MSFNFFWIAILDIVVKWNFYNGPLLTWWEGERRAGECPTDL